MKKIPYGTANFEQIIRGDFYYIDKSRYIQTVEDQNLYLLLTRPRRMGKSLFTNMLASYYDLAKRDEFDELFGNLWIGSHRTEWANKFVVLKFDFSYVKCELDQLEASFEAYCFGQIKEFFDRYDTIYTEDERAFVLSRSSAKDAVLRLVNTSHRKKLPIYLFIDEYDNFTNTVLTARGVSAHEQITHGEGFYRDFFKCCKGTFDRIFMTGVTPVSYDDLNSGFSIADVVSLERHFNHIIGVTEDELRQMIEYYRSCGMLQRDTDTIVAEMKPWYDNFCFSEACFGKEAPIYNTDMVLNYMRKILVCDETPKDMVGYSGRTDPQKLRYLVTAEDLDDRERRMEIISGICSKGYTSGDVAVQFPAARAGEEANFKSMLYYLGTLTFGGWDEDGLSKLIVTNRTMGELYLSYMIQMVSERDREIESKRRSLNDALRSAAVRGDWMPMVQALGKLYHDYTSIRNTRGGEYDVQGFLRGMLCLNSFFAVWPELELGHGYSDILLLPKGTPQCPTLHSYVIELKYMRVGDKDAEAMVSEACRQLDRYVSDIRLPQSPLLHNTDITKLYLIFQGTELLKYGLSDL